MTYHFRRARKGETEIVYSMIADRVQWMNDQGIRQWNSTNYLNVYPLTYYQDNLSQLYVLVDEDTEMITCAAILFENDDRWNSEEAAFYIHNFVSTINISGVGKIFISEAEHFAVQEGKIYLRLDSSDDNQKLEQYYESMGFKSCGVCQDGNYRGILRQKKLTK